MPGPVMCECGAVLLEEIDERGVRPAGSDERVAFRRTTDHVICTACMRSYGVRDLFSRTTTPEVIDLLERLARRMEQDPQG